MLSGRRPRVFSTSSPLDVEMDDIAYTAGARGALERDRPKAPIFSVAQHVLLVEALGAAKTPTLDARGRLAVLLYRSGRVRDRRMISPFKSVIGDSYKAAENRLLAAIHVRFGLPAKPPDNLLDAWCGCTATPPISESTRLAGSRGGRSTQSRLPPKYSAAMERDYLTAMPASTLAKRFCR